MNKVQLIGMVGNDPELKQTGTGKPYVNLRVGTKERPMTKSDGTKAEAQWEWHNVMVWGITAETVFKYVHKGDKIYIDGRIQYRKYTDRQGAEKYITDIICNDVEFLFNRVYQTPQQNGQPQNGYQQPQYQQPQQQMMNPNTPAPAAPAPPPKQNNDPQETLPF